MNEVGYLSCEFNYGISLYINAEIAVSLTILPKLLQ
jgi:hypothetical protein